MAGLLSLGFISFFQGVFQPSSSNSSKNALSQSDVMDLFSVEEASADAPYSQAYYQGYYEDYYQSSYDPGPVPDGNPEGCPAPDGPCPGPK